MKKIKIGFLPFYIKLYDDTGNGAAARPRLWQFYLSLCERFEKLGFEVVRTNDLCRIEPEFRAAVDSAERDRFAACAAAEEIAETDSGS